MKSVLYKTNFVRKSVFVCIYLLGGLCLFELLHISYNFKASKHVVEIECF